MTFPLGDESLVNTTTALQQTDAAVTRLGDGGFVVVWTGFVPGGRGGSVSDIFAQRYDASGAKVGGEFRVNTTTAGAQIGPDVTATRDGFVVVWQDGGAAFGDAGPVGQRFDAQGRPLGGEFLVQSQSDGFQSLRSLGSLSDGGFIVGFQRLGQNNEPGDGRARVFGSDGAPAGPDFILPGTESGTDQTELEGRSDGGWIGVYLTSGFNGPRQYGVRVFDQTGAVAASAPFLYYGEAVALPDGGLAVLYLEPTPGTLNVNTLHLQVFDAAAQPVGDPQTVAGPTDVGLNTAQGQIALLSDGGLAVAWRQGSDLFVREYADGAPRSGPVQVNTLPLGEGGHSLAAYGEGLYVVVWNETGQTRADDADGSVRARLFAAASTTPTSGDDDIQGGPGKDLVRAGLGDDTVNGGDGADRLFGNAGDDRLIGGPGRDALSGGSGRDTFVFTSVDDSPRRGAVPDRISDFRQGEDKIDLSGIDVVRGGVDTPFSFIGTAAFSRTAGELRIVQAGADTLIQADVDGDGRADMDIRATGVIDFDMSDFVL